MTMPQSWDEKHRKSSSPIAACELLQKCQELLPTAGTALDLACGRGGNTIELARRGFAVTACDSSAEAIKILQQELQRTGLGAAVKTVTADAATILEDNVNCYDLVIASRFLDRSLTAKITAALKTNGLILYQTFTEDSDNGPTNPDFILRRNELMRMFGSSEYLLIHYHEYGALQPKYDYAELIARKK